jgi:hypothetical protein
MRRALKAKRCFFGGKKSGEQAAPPHALLRRHTCAPATRATPSHGTRRVASC